MCACCAIWPSLGLGAALRGRDRALAGLVAVPPIKVVRMPSISSHTCVEADGGGEVIRGGVQVRVVGSKGQDNAEPTSGPCECLHAYSGNQVLVWFLCDDNAKCMHASPRA